MGCFKKFKSRFYSPQTRTLRVVRGEPDPQLLSVTPEGASPSSSYTSGGRGWVFKAALGLALRCFLNQEDATLVLESQDAGDPASLPLSVHP